MDERIVNTKELMGDDARLDNTLRPRTLEEYVGQSQIKDNLSIFMTAARQRGGSRTGAGGGGTLEVRLLAGAST